MEELRQLHAEYEYFVSEAKQTEKALQAQAAQQERVCGQLAQRLQAAQETIAAHEQVRGDAEAGRARLALIHICGHE